MVQKHYVNIERMKEKYVSAFSKNEHIVVQVKLDGANSAIAYDNDNNCLTAFSRKQQLSEENTLQGFYNFVQTLDVELFKEVLGTRYIIFGEFLSPHSVKYPKDMYYQFYMFDVWDCNIGQYLSQKDSYGIFSKLKGQIKNYVKTLYDGPFISWEHIKNFLNENLYGETPTMEGVVIKSQDRLDNRSSKTPPYVKIVSERFSEVQKSSKPKEIDPEVLAARQAAEKLAATIVTERRVEKLLEKMVDEGILPKDWDEHDMKTVSKNLPKACYEDCQKEEPEVVAQIENFGKICGSLAMKHAKALLK